MIVAIEQGGIFEFDVKRCLQTHTCTITELSKEFFRLKGFEAYFYMEVAKIISISIKIVTII
jgi:hypothetical protein